MATIVFLSSHTDDEVTLSGGAMAMAVVLGHRVVRICATDGAEAGEQGLDDGVAESRREEARQAGDLLGIQRLEFWEFTESGRLGWSSNDAPGALMKADPDELVARVVALLDEEDALALVTYDHHGLYGHPDRSLLHRVAHAAAKKAARTPRVLEATLNRDAMRQEGGAMNPDDPQDDGHPFGTPEAELAWQVDLGPAAMVKREALAAHASITEAAPLLAAPDEVYLRAYRYEYYREAGREPMKQGWPFTAE